MKRVSFLIIFSLLIAGIVGWSIALAIKVRQKPEPIKPAVAGKIRVIAKRDLRALTLLKDPLIAFEGGTDDSTHDYSGRYLLEDIKSGEEIKRDKVAVKEASAVLSNAVAVNIPGSSGTTLGGQLRVGDLVDVTAVSPKEAAGARKFEKLVVLTVGQPIKDTTIPSSITLAVPTAQSDDFTAAISGANLLVTRKILVYE